jgi:hypothetical protein
MSASSTAPTLRSQDIERDADDGCPAHTKSSEPQPTDTNAESLHRRRKPVRIEKNPSTWRPHTNSPPLTSNAGSGKQIDRTIFFSAGPLGMAIEQQTSQ